jgi:hypothetical protein
MEAALATGVMGEEDDVLWLWVIWKERSES